MRVTIDAALKTKCPRTALACVTAYGLSVLAQKRSLLTERLAGRGFHLSREYGVDPLETVMVGQAMHTSVFALPANATRKDAADWLTTMHQRGADAWSHWQRLFPLVDEDGRLVAVLTRSQMMAAAQEADLARPLREDGRWCAWRRCWRGRLELR